MSSPGFSPSLTFDNDFSDTVTMAQRTLYNYDKEIPGFRRGDQLMVFEHLSRPCEQVSVDVSRDISLPKILLLLVTKSHTALCAWFESATPGANGQPTAVLNMIYKLCHSNLKYLLLTSFIRRGADEEANSRVPQRLSNDEEKPNQVT